MTYTSDELSEIDQAELTVANGYLVAARKAKSKMELDQCLYGIMSHVAKLADAYHNSTLYYDLPNKPGETNDEVS